jgi:hypothetical protein
MKLLDMAPDYIKKNELLIGIAGPTQSGKSTIAKIVQEASNGALYECGYVLYKDALQFLELDLPISHYDNFKTQNIPGSLMPGRDLLISFGQLRAKIFGESSVVIKTGFLSDDSDPKKVRIVSGLRTHEQIMLITNLGGLVLNTDPTDAFGKYINVKSKDLKTALQVGVKHKILKDLYFCTKTDTHKFYEQSA